MVYRIVEAAKPRGGGIGGLKVRKTQLTLAGAVGSMHTMEQKLSIRKTKRLRQVLAKHYALPDPPDRKDNLVDQLVMTVLWVDAQPAKARQAYAKLAEEFVDWNELRVSMTPEAGSVLEACDLAPVKAVAIKRILGKAVEEFYTFDFEALAQKPRKELKNWFLSIEDIPHPIAAAALYQMFDYDRVLVDADVARVVRRLGLVPETAAEAEIEAGLADVIPAREAYFIYSALRQHANTVCTKKDFDCRTCPLRGECETGKVRIAQLEAAAREAKKKAIARAKARAKAKAAAQAAAKAAAKAKRKAKPSPKAPARKPKKKP